MGYQGRAYYNYLQRHIEDFSKENLQTWQIEDYRHHPTSLLLSKLSELGIDLDPDNFLLIAEDVMGPEEVTALVVKKDSSLEVTARAYLLILELWKRLCKDKQSLSTYCDDFDYQIYLFEEEAAENEELLLSMLDDLSDILDKSTDEENVDERQIFELVDEYFSIDLEGFIFDFVKFLIENEYDTRASELIDSFGPYVENTLWFDFLKICLVELVDAEEATLMMQRLIDRAVEEQDVELLFEVLNYLAFEEDIPLFIPVFEITHGMISKEEDFQELLIICSDYLNAMDREADEQMILDMIESRQTKTDASDKFNPDDKDFLTLKFLVVSK